LSVIEAYPAARALDGRRRWWILTAALTVQVTVSIILQGYPALVPFVKRDLHLSLAQAGVFASIPGLGMALGVMAAAWAVDRSGDRHVLTWGGVATGVIAVLTALSPSYAVLLLASVAVGLGAATPTPAGSRAVLAEFPRRQRGLVMSVRQTGVPAGGFIAAIALPILSVHLGWRDALAFAGGAAVLGGFACMICYRMAGGARELRRPAEEQAVSVFTLLNRNLLKIGGSGIVLVMGQYCLVTYVVLFLNHTRGLPLVLASFFLAATQLAGSFGRVFWGWFSDRVVGGSRRTALMVVGLVGAAGVLLLAWLPASAPFLLVVVAVVVAGGCVVGWNGVWITMLAEVAPPGLQARSIAAGLMINQPAILVGPWVFGLVVDATGSYQLAWTGLAALLVVAAWLITRADDPMAAPLPAAALP
jgi:predicted MFS family arabinose efflux permease